MRFEPKEGDSMSAASTTKAVFLSHETIYTEGLHFATFMFDQHSAYTYGNVGQYHDFYEIQLYMHADGDSDELLAEATVEGRTCRMYHRSLLLINIFDMHMIEVKSRKCIRHCINVSPNVLHFACSRHSQLLNMFDSSDPFYPACIVGEDFEQRYLRLMDALRTANLAHGNDIYKKGILLMSVALVYNHYRASMNSINHDAKLPELVYGIIEYVDSHLDTSLTLDQLADALHFSTYYLSHRFKEYTGIPIGKYILDKKMDLAKNLLAVYDAKEVGRRIGYKNYSSFFQNFRKNTGLSPSDYRTMLLSEKKKNAENSSLVNNQDLSVNH